MERTYVIPLRKGWLKAQRYKRAKKAINTLKEFLKKHMKSEDVRLGTHLNLFVWKHGIRCPPSRVKVNVSKDDKGVVRAELFGAPVEVKKVVEEKKGIVKRIAEKVTGKEAKPAAPVEKPAEVKPEVKPAVKPASVAPKAPVVKKPEAVVKKVAPAPVIQ
ncbi:50S ribosomal protein L31e [uncultured archaeon]|nr:50S ribosomal protein L31e [uncultured archaeon]